MRGDTLTEAAPSHATPQALRLRDGRSDRVTKKLGDYWSGGPFWITEVLFDDQRAAHIRLRPPRQQCH
jgi:hypothetical protein